MRRGPRYEARQLGLKQYFTGLPCKNGHVANRLVSNKCCIECHKFKARAFRHADGGKRHMEYVRRSRKKYPEKTLELSRKLHKKHRIKRNAYSRLYNKRNRKKLNAYNREWIKRDNNAAKFHRIGLSLRGRLLLALKGRQRAGSAVRDLGCSIEWFMAYIAAKFDVGMTWENHGKVWQLDHIKPLGQFDLTKRKHFLEACHFTNLQPLTIESHRKKSAMEATHRRRY